MITANDTILLIDLKDCSKRYLVAVSQKKFSTKRGEINLEELIGKDFGIIIKTHLGAKYAVVRPTLHDKIMQGVSRQTQIVYPKDSGFIAIWLGLANGQRIFECGSGSGAMTIILANAVAPDGIVVSYDCDERFYEQAQKNITKFGLAKNVEFHLRDIENGIDGAPYDAVFIDVREPWNYIQHIWSALSGGAPVCFVLPTTNQLQELLRSFETHKGFIDIRVAETIMRFYKPVADRLRPEDRMVAHTTFIVMARKILIE